MAPPPASIAPLSAWSVTLPFRQPDSALALAVAPGYSAQQLIHTKKSKSSAPKRTPMDASTLSALQSSKAWEIAMGPAKSVPMNAFMLYMSGSGVQIFSMMVVGMMITNPFKAIAGMQTAFAPYESPSHSLLLQKASFILCQLACVCLGVYKCWSMGLLPTESSDWLAWRQPRIPLELFPLYS